MPMSFSSSMDNAIALSSPDSLLNHDLVFFVVCELIDDWDKLFGS